MPGRGYGRARSHRYHGVMPYRFAALRRVSVKSYSFSVTQTNYVIDMVELSFLRPPAGLQFTLRDHGYETSASHGVPVYDPYIADTHCAY